jgi:hypothetical protein
MQTLRLAWHPKVAQLKAITLLLLYARKHYRKIHIQPPMPLLLTILLKFRLKEQLEVARQQIVQHFVLFMIFLYQNLAMVARMHLRVSMFLNTMVKTDWFAGRQGMLLPLQFTMN